MVFLWFLYGSSHKSSDPPVISPTFLRLNSARPPKITRSTDKTLVKGNRPQLWPPPQRNGIANFTPDAVSLVLEDDGICSSLQNWVTKIGVFMVENVGIHMTQHYGNRIWDWYLKRQFPGCQIQWSVLERTGDSFAGYECVMFLLEHIFYGRKKQPSSGLSSDVVWTERTLKTHHLCKKLKITINNTGKLYLWSRNML